MSWVTSDSIAGRSAPSEDAWCDDDDGSAPSVDPIEALRRRMETLGQNEGLERGMAQGEAKGFAEGFKGEAPRAAMLGRCLGAAKVALKVHPKNGALARAIQEAEQIAAQSWVGNSARVDEALSRLYQEVNKVGIAITEWPSTNPDA
jgi:hypothetical protein